MEKGSKSSGTRKCHIVDIEKLHKALKTFPPPMYFDKPNMQCIYIPKN